MAVQIVEVGRTVRAVDPELGDRDQSIDCARRFVCLGEARISGRAVVVVGADCYLEVRILPAQCRRNRLEIPGIEGNSDSVTSRFVDAGRSRESFGNADHAVRPADGVVATCYATAAQVPLVTCGINELKG